MGKELIAFRMEDYLRKMSESNMKLLFTTYGFKLLGIVTWDRMLPDEQSGLRRRWVKGLVVENGTPLKPEEKVFETSLHRRNQKSGQLEDVIAHEDDLAIVMERKTFDLDDDESNFQFMPNMHVMNRMQQIMDEIEEGRRRLVRLGEEKNQSLLDSEHFKREALSAKEREKMQREVVNRLTRENGMLQEKLGNLESTANRLYAKNLELEAFMDETIATAQERGTVKGMTQDDLIAHAVEKKAELQRKMLDIEPEAGGADEAVYDDIDDMKKRMKGIEQAIERLAGGAKQEPARQTEGA